MFGFFKKEKPEVVNVTEIAQQMTSRYWDCAIKDESTVIVYGNYKNHGRNYDQLLVRFKDSKVHFLDVRGRAITGVPESVSTAKLYPTMKNILNVI